MHGQKEHLSFGKCTIIFFNSAEKFVYSPEFESVIIDTGNETRKPQIQIVTTGTNNLIKTYQGCSTMLAPGQRDSIVRFATHFTIVISNV